MKNQLIFIILITFSLSVKAQIYTPSGTIQGTSTNNNVGIGTSNTTAKLTIQAGPDGYPTPLKAISIWGPNSPENSNSAQAISWDFAAAGSAALRCYRGGSWDTYMQFLTNSNSAAGNNPQVRMHITGEGNVGIGTTDPLFKLDVKGGGRFLVPDDKSGVGGLTIETINGTNLKIGGNSTYSWIQSHAALPLYINELGNNTILNPVNGNVGIGTSNPLAKLSINGGSILVKNETNVDNSSSIMIAQSIKDGDYTNLGTSIGTITQNAGNNTYGMQFFTMESYLTGQTEKVRVLGNGNVGIGTTIPDEKLTVKGKIHAQEVRIDLLAPIVPDYVFANDYKLKSLQQVEDYIKENSHLPEIPSAKEIEKNGLMLAEMNMSLLKKIEELTLYMIKQNKRLDNIESENKELKNKIKLIEKNKN